MPPWHTPINQSHRPIQPISISHSNALISLKSLTDHIPYITFLELPIMNSPAPTLTLTILTPTTLTLKNLTLTTLTLTTLTLTTLTPWPWQPWPLQPWPWLWQLCDNPDNPDTDNPDLSLLLFPLKCSNPTKVLTNHIRYITFLELPIMNSPGPDPDNRDLDPYNHDPDNPDHCVRCSWQQVILLWCSWWPPSDTGVPVGPI